MATITKRRRQVKSAPECKILRAVELVQGLDFGGSFAVLRICVGRDEALYVVEPILTPLGKAAKFIKQGEVDPLEDGSGWHDTLLAGENTTCSCKGFTRWGRCKHVFALDVATRRGWLP